MDKIFRKRGGRSYKFNGIIPEGWYLELETGETYKSMDEYAEYVRKEVNRQRALKAAKSRKDNKKIKDDKKDIENRE